MGFAWSILDRIKMRGGIGVKIYLVYQEKIISLIPKDGDSYFGYVAEVRKIGQVYCKQPMLKRPLRKYEDSADDLCKTEEAFDSPLWVKGTYRPEAS